MLRAQDGRRADRRRCSLGIQTSARKERTMAALDAERDPRIYAVDDDPMRASVVHNGARTPPTTADPAPLGLGAFGLTLLVFSMFSAGLLAVTGEPVVLGIALAYGGVAQLLAGMWEFRRGNTFGAAVFGSYGAFWLSYWMLQQFFVGKIPGPERGSAIALFYISWAILTALLWIASTRTTAVVSLMLFLLTLTYLMLGIGDAGSHAEIVKVGGWFGLATSATALYAAFAAVFNSTVERTVLPLVPLRRAQR
jgi:succinate-acetate transporter protein